MKYIYLFALLSLNISTAFGVTADIDKLVVEKGIIKLQSGIVDKYTPYSFCSERPRSEALTKLEEGVLPFPLESIDIFVSERGCEISIPLQIEEQLYGFGLQIGSFQQRGLKKKPIVNAYPLNTLGYSHAPQPFYVSSLGYGILINTLRYTTFYCGTNKKKSENQEKIKVEGNVSSSVSDLYKNEKNSNRVYVDIPGAKGVEVYVFTGKDLLSVVQKYNLFSGGGCLPPLWGLGFKYRTKTDCSQEGVLQVSSYFREKKIPCDVIGLEPGWHSAAYSCSYVWNKTRFPKHRDMLTTLKERNFRVNLWEHAYVHPTSPIWKPLQEYSGDFLVWRGLVPDFILPEARKIFADHHQVLVDEGISGFKLDECDNSDISQGTANWGFPDMSKFPSGIDGEQMHQAFGTLYLHTLNDVFRKENRRTYQDYRSSGLFVSSLPATIYSDIYGHKDYVQMVCNAAFGGLLWSPEVRESSSVFDFFHRLQTVLLSPHAVVDSWYLQNPPWLQFDKNKNNKNEFADNRLEMESMTRKLVNIRMKLLPYLYDAFALYYEAGVPPFRPLVMDYPKDKKVQNLSDQYMMGDRLLVAPLFDDSNKRKLYLPEGIWYNFNTNEKYEGGREYEVTVKMDEMPLFVKGGSILPLADPVQFVSNTTSFDITCCVYGNADRPVSLFEDDGVSYNYRNGDFNKLSLWVEKGKGKVKRNGNYKKKRYSIKKWEFIK